MIKIEDEADYYIQDADARMRSCKPEDLPTFTEQLKGAFIAGANKVRGQLTARYEVEIAKYKRDLNESWEREKIACKAVAEKRKEIALLTKWNNPKDKLPPDDREVLCMIDCCYNTYLILKHNDLGWWMLASNGGRCVCAFEVIGWREIPE